MSTAKTLSELGLHAMGEQLLPLCVDVDLAAGLPILPGGYTLAGTDAEVTCRRCLTASWVEPSPVAELLVWQHAADGEPCEPHGTEQSECVHGLRVVEVWVSQLPRETCPECGGTGLVEMILGPERCNDCINGTRRAPS